MSYHLPGRKVKSDGSSMLRRAFFPAHDRATIFRRVLLTAALLSVIFLIASGVAPADAKQKIKVGAVENVVLLPWGVSMPARIDTGATTSSLDARNLVVKGNMVEFSLPPAYGGQRVQLPLLKWRTVKTAEAQERRPVVIIDLCIGSRQVRTHVNLNDRSNVKYPLLIGRNTLRHGFMVECSASYCTQPSCPEVTPK